MKHQTEDLRIRAIDDVLTPAALHAEFPISDKAAETVFDTRAAIHSIIHGGDSRLLVVVGPCSIHDPAAARDYAGRLVSLRARYADSLLLVMRVYFEKPRTTIGWKGLVNDPGLDGSFRINDGLRIARSLLLDLNEMGMPAGTEFLDLITPQYITDLISWGAIGARTTESQVHRELASGLSCPVGFKNGTDGNVRIAVDACRAASHPHCFLSMTMTAQSAIFSTTGNEDCHVILRGGRSTNYDAASVAAACREIAAAGLPPRVMVDFSHANSSKQHERQRDVASDVAAQMLAGDSSILGCMIESHLVAGRQDVRPDQPLVYGQSITDACIGWDDTERVLGTLATAVRDGRNVANSASRAG